MLNPLKFRGEDSNFLFISDLHVNQKCINWNVPLYKMRGFDSIEDHKRGIIDSWNQECNFNSVVFNLGDMMFDDPKGEEFYKLIDQLNFKELYLMFGNHWSGTKYHYLQQLKKYNLDSKLEVYPLEWKFNSIKTIYFIPNYIEIYINSHPVVLSHYPVWSFNGQKDGCFMISGHQHSNDPYTAPFTGIGKRLDVSWESFKKPVSFKFLKNFLKDRDLDIKDHHK